MQRDALGAPDKEGHEAFRVGKFARPHPNLCPAGHSHPDDGDAESRGASSEEPEAEDGDAEEDDLGKPDCSRVVLHFDAGENCGCDLYMLGCGGDRVQRWGWGADSVSVRLYRCRLFLCANRRAARPVPALHTGILWRVMYDADAVA